jgi:hypothetical protein
MASGRSSDKCKTMRIGRSKVEKHEYTFKADLKPMEETIAEKDVGVTIDNKLSFDKHITEKGRDRPWNFNIHFSDQACNRCIFFCKSSQSLVLYISLKIFVSSTYKYGSLANSMASGRSFIYVNHTYMLTTQRFLKKYIKLETVKTYRKICIYCMPGQKNG